MTADDLGAVLKGIAPVVREFIATSVEALVKRLEALEERPVVHGRDGRDGEKGFSGEPGARGEQGPPGPVGEIGPAGPIGDRGEKGLDGADGLSGEPGPAGPMGDSGPAGPVGVSGRDGQPGVPGRDGAKGFDGAAGRDGLDGKDGLGFDDLEVLHDGERGFTFQFSRGDQVKSFAFTIPCVIYRGVWTERAYEKGDSVTFGGCQWIAKDSTTVKPDFTPAAAKNWSLAVKEGRKGKDGLNGRDGKDGKDR